MKKGIKALLPIIGIILSTLGFLNIIGFDIVLSALVLIIGVSSILNGYYSYLKNKKRESISLILTGFIIIIIVILRIFLKILLSI